MSNYLRRRVCARVCLCVCVLPPDTGERQDDDADRGVAGLARDGASIVASTWNGIILTLMSSIGCVKQGGGVCLWRATVRRGVDPDAFIDGALGTVGGGSF